MIRVLYAADFRARKARSVTHLLGARFLPVGYAVARDDTDLLLYLDTWLLTAKANGTVDELYRYWMLGEVKQTQPPRWSVIRNVLGWTD